jgi:hypothetical protein
VALAWLGNRRKAPARTPEPEKAVLGFGRLTRRY